LPQATIKRRILWQRKIMYSFFVKNTFIHVAEQVDPAAVKRHNSCPPAMITAPRKLCTESNASIKLETSNRVSASLNEAHWSQNRKSRPCRGKRLRFSNFANKVRTQMESDPISFRLHEVTLPPSLVSNARKRKSFESSMQRYHQELLNRVHCTRVG